MRTRTCTATCIGDRVENEDRAVALSRDGMTLLVVADGMGGHEMGAEAAEAAVDRIGDLFQAMAKGTNPATFLAGAMEEAHRAVLTMGQDMPIEMRPRTTCVAALLVPPALWTAHLGDSRAYVFRDDAVLMQTRDHSHVEELIAAGEISEDQRHTHPLRNLVDRCCGGEPERVQTTVNGPVKLQPGDVVLLCSDGFWDALYIEDVARVLREAGDPARTLDELAAIACESAAPQADNATAAVLRIEPE